ncbi:helix-turn-helix domain-containing protein [Mycobacterium sp. SMC-4]|uniref:AraC family transcriptional regulator n=1 Tax=Mycobacterium sp. SMC-4 TaxID=2857059 RepID=UPI003D08088F
MNQHTPSTSSPPHQRDELRFVSTDLGATEDFLSKTYTKMSLAAEPGEQTQTRIERHWLGPITFDEVRVGFHMSYDANPIGLICLCRVHEGHIEENFIGESTDVFAPGDVTLLSPPDEPYSGRACQASYDLTMFDPVLLDRVAGRGDSIRLLGHRPVSRDAGRQLFAAIDYVSAVAHGDQPVTPLVASTTASLLAAVVLSALPNTANTGPAEATDGNAKPAVLRRAVAYIDSRADHDIALADIAAAVHLTPRALQYMFRRHLDLTPMEYLRRVRLDHAHRDLLRADPSETSVHTIATRWGFAHAGRFATMYRQNYGCAPSDTLKS